MNTIPDPMLDQILADPRAVENITGALRASGLETPFEALSRDQQKDIVAQIIAQQQQAAQQGGIQVDLAALGVSAEDFDALWKTSLREADGDVPKLASLVEARLKEAGAPDAAIADLLAQFPSNDADS